MDIIKLTLNFISTTDKSLFLTGKAGTGKTTFLNALRQNIYKKWLPEGAIFIISCLLTQAASVRDTLEF